MHIYCVQVKFPGASPGSCEVLVFGVNIGTVTGIRDVLGPLVIAGSFTGIIPLGNPAVGAGGTIPFAITSSGYGCIGLGGAVGTVGKSINVGFLFAGDMSNYQNVLRGWGNSINIQSNPLAGVQVLWNSSGTVAGNTFGTVGVALSRSFSVCGTL